MICLLRCARLAPLALALWLGLTACGASQDGDVRTAGKRRAPIVCGLTGDAAHRQVFADSTEKIYSGLIQHHGFAAENVAVLWSEAPAEKDGPAVKASRGLATREVLTQTVAELEKTLKWAWPSTNSHSVSSATTAVTVG